MREGGRSIRWLALGATVLALLTASCEGDVDRVIVDAGTEDCGMPEVCNLLDDDCDGMTDEGACNAGDACHSTGCLHPCDAMGDCPTNFTCISWAEGLYCLRISG
jgi:hypothetical protein